MTDAVAVGFDLGGTNLRAALVAGDGTVLDRVRGAHPGDDGPALLREIAAIAARLGPGLPVGVGVAGLVSRGRFTYGPNLPLPAMDLSAGLRDALGRTVPVANDATLATLAEWQVGVAAGHDDVIMATMGTGVGGGLVVGGRLVGGHAGYAGELGHTVVVADGRPCACGNRGCVEAYASGTGVAGLAADAVASGVATSLAAIDRPDGGDVQAAADAGDDVALDILQRAGRLLGIALAGLVNVTDPSIVVLGGGAFARSSAHVLPAVREALAGGILGAGQRTPPPVVAAALGDDAGVVGAALLAATPSLLATDRQPADPRIIGDDL